MLSNQAYFYKEYDWIDFRIKNLGIYLASDFVATFTRIPFEARKQLVQMANYNLDMSIIIRNSRIGLTALMARDMIFRFTLMSTYYSTTHIEHQPKMRYSVQEIVHYMKVRREAGYEDSLKSM